MARRRAFDMCHPSVNLLYFLLVLVCSVGCMHPPAWGFPWAVPGLRASVPGAAAVGRLLGLLGPVALLAAGETSFWSARGRRCWPGCRRAAADAGKCPLWPGGYLPAGGGGALVCQLAGGAHGG